MGRMDTTTELIEQAETLERRADLLDAALLAPSMKSRTLREEATKVRRLADAMTDYEVGDKVLRAGFEGVVTAVHTDDLAGTYDVRLASGEVTVPGSELRAS